MAEDPQKRTRNLWFAFLRLHGWTIREIAASEGVSEDTVLRGLKDAKTYPQYRISTS